jgi:glycosyltransferase involved in cell wall biosynthesis
MEAMACATPVAAFDAGGISDMIEHTRTGYLAAPRDSEDLAQGIRWCLTHGKQLGTNARRKVEACYAYPVAARRYIELYEEALS